MTGDDTGLSPSPLPENPEIRWRALPPQQLISREIAAVHALYNRLSGATHLLHPMAKALLHLLSEQALDRVAIVAALRRDYDLVVEDDLDAAVLARLDELDRLGLIVPVAG